MSSYREERNILGILDPRKMCYACHRPASHCVCSLVVPFKAHCDFLLLQHPHERKKYHSTAKLVLKAITNSKMLRGITFEEKEISAALDGKNPYLLYPGEDAIDCESAPLNEESTVIVIDGTWVEARKIMYRNAYLRSLPKISFKQGILSQYKIRKQPKDFCLSTLECIVHLLKKSIRGEDTTARLKEYESLFSGFEKMVDKQLHYFPRMKNQEVEK